MEHWSDREKKIARRVFEAALMAELDEVIADFKARVAAIAEPEDMWSLEGHLSRAKREIESKYDYRYSQLLYVFGRLVREGRIHDLLGLDEGKLAIIRNIVAL